MPASGRRRAGVLGGAVLIGAYVLGLLGVNQRDGAWEALIILAVMFTGTALYRWHAGQIRPWRALLAVTYRFIELPFQRLGRRVPRSA